MSETVYVSVNTGKSRLIQAAALLVVTLGVVVMFYLREQRVGLFIPPLLAMVGGSLVKLSRGFRDQVPYNPPQNDMERQLLEKLRLIKGASLMLLCGSLLALEYCTVLHWGGASAVAGIGAVLLASLGMLVYAIAEGERFQRRAIPQ